MSKQLSDFLKSTRYYDIHYFLEDSHTKRAPRVVQKAKGRKKSDMYKARPLLEIQNSEKELDLIINKMMYPPDRPEKMPDWEVYRPRTTQ